MKPSTGTIVSGLTIFCDTRKNILSNVGLKSNDECRYYFEILVRRKGSARREEYRTIFVRWRSHVGFFLLRTHWWNQLLVLAILPEYKKTFPTRITYFMKVSFGPPVIRSPSFES